MFINSVITLREREQKNVRKPFVARGSSLKRCSACMLSEYHCMCKSRPSVQTSCAVCLMYYQGEVFKPSNTGRLIADVVADNYAFQWQRTEVDPAFLSLLNDPAYRPILVFPHEYAQTNPCIQHVDDLPDFSQKKPLYILLDGTWREAKKMFRSAYFKDLPVLGLQPTEASQYQLREAAHSHQLCTAEVGVEVLRAQGDSQAAEAMQRYFQLFRERYLADRANVKLKNIGRSSMSP